MPISREMRKLKNKWDAGRSWPKRIESLVIKGIRGWTGQRIDFRFPFIAIVGENGVGKSTILQSLAAVYRGSSKKLSHFASDFFPDTPWEQISNGSIGYYIREGDQPTISGTVRKPTGRWRGNPDRHERPVRYVDLRRMQPIAAQVGYSKIAKTPCSETKSESFAYEKLKRLSAIAGRQYDVAGYALTDVDEKRWVPVVESGGARYSGFHQGAGETALADLLKTDFTRYGLVLIDELETSLHPRSQRRLVRELAEICRDRELQIIVTTHSPYILEELPMEGRLLVMNTSAGKMLVTGVSPFFAMTQMDEERHPDIDLYVEDDNSRIVLEELITVHRKQILPQCAIIPCGAASVLLSLGQMVAGDRFPRKSLAFLDADQEVARGCLVLPGEDAPERVVFESLRKKDWAGVAERLGRSHTEVVDALSGAMTIEDHHEWLRNAATKLILGTHTLWRVMASVWAERCVDPSESRLLIDQIENALDGMPFKDPYAAEGPPPLQMAPKIVQTSFLSEPPSDDISFFG